MRAIFSLIICIVFSGVHHLKAQCSSKEFTSGSSASFRALSVFNDSVAWAGGAAGTILYTQDAGIKWLRKSIPDCPQCDFRTLYVLNATSAIVANAGLPARVYLTHDTGNSWHRVFEWTDSAAFIDGIAFFNRKHGLIYGDPIDGRMRLIRTRNGGKSWKEMPYSHRPKTIAGEASFAASGTTIQAVGKRTVLIATGGTQSRILLSANRGRTWRSVATPMLQGMPSRGIFSIWASGKRNWVIAGGDYLHDSVTTDICFYTNDGGKHWRAPQSPPRGYRECLVQIAAHTLLAIGPTGIDISTDAGKHWQPCSDEKKLHVARRARSGHWVVAAGGAGKILSIGR